jgi:hypothetical protein
MPAPWTPSLLPIANEIASQQANPTQKGFTTANRVLSYISKRHNNCITYYACDMHLFLHVDASYLSNSVSRPLRGRWIFFSLETKINLSTSMELHMSFPQSSHASSPTRAKRNMQLSSRVFNMQQVYEPFYSAILATHNPQV